MEYPKVDIRDICGALGISYSRAFSIAYYLKMIYELSLIQRVSEHGVHPDFACTCGKCEPLEGNEEFCKFTHRPISQNH
jgi:hypothetical protein